MSMKLNTNIHHVSGYIAKRFFRVKDQGWRS